MPLHKVALKMAELVNENKLVLHYGCFWAIKDSPLVNIRPLFPLRPGSEASTDGPPIVGNPVFIGPVWEPAFAKALWSANLPIIQQYPAENYFLDIAMISEDGRYRLDIEVDGKSSHCDQFGRRKVRDVIRDARLTSAGWTIRRFWVSELMHDIAGCVDQVKELWSNREKDH
ncbi:MAG: DUF559 domain-containing protein [Bacteroidales bacterium]|nr:DUF559 domain-containing protein [Bacteroidales bacterium]